MAKKYDEYCPMAHALSLVGERWALLVVRELLAGPKRYTDLAHGLPGIGTNILAARLRDLEAAGVVTKRKLPPPTPATVYELTPYGAGLEVVMHALARWGARSLGPPTEKDQLGPDWGLSALSALFDDAAARGLTETYVLDIDGSAFTARIQDGKLERVAGAVEDADLTVRTDTETFFALASGDLDPDEALEQGRATIEGDAEVLRRCFRVLSLAPRVRTAAATA